MQKLGSQKELGVFEQKEKSGEVQKGDIQGYRLERKPRG